MATEQRTSQMKHPSIIDAIERLEDAPFSRVGTLYSHPCFNVSTGFSAGNVRQDHTVHFVSQHLQLNLALREDH